ncbi:SDR family NAD(P)-dependent oxidoreductase [Amycolatopsis speibonae]|uniref:SDR family NAD(P)-dependent oxidoreductase n=1 Tax=Amycolatopsis speibonae TaxID=1450224 RepID=A0ABV7P9J9_9PSEU
MRKEPVSSTAGEQLRRSSPRVLLTGGGHGFGKACAEQVASSGASVFITGRDGQALAETVDVIRGSGGTADFMVADLADSSAVAEAVDKATRLFGGIDVLVNNGATTGPIGPLWSVDDQAWWHTMEVNLRGAWSFTSKVVSGMVDQGSGRVINVVSRAGQYRWPYASAYSVSKAALISLTANLAGELRGTGVTAIAFDPGILDAGMTKAHFQRGHTDNPWENRIHDWFRAAQDTGGFTEVDAAVRALEAVTSGAADHLSGKYVTTESLGAGLIPAAR